MGINKIAYGNTTLIDLTGDTVQADKLMQGYTAHDRSGALITGTATGGSGDGYVWQDANGYVHLSDEQGTQTIIDTLNVNASGTYTAPTGHAYSPVTVNVSGGGDTNPTASKKQINFIDYDGTIRYSYTSAEWANVSALPSNPSHTGLTAQGWNWTKAQITAQLTAVPNGDIWVGQMYITQSGDTEIDVVFPDSTKLDPILTIAVNGTIEVDWDDNTTPDTVTGTSLTTRQAVPHTYASTGSYTIKIHVVSGSITFYGSTQYYILRKNTTGAENRIYTNYIKAIRLGSNITNIGDYAFYYCQSLVNITMPNSITNIGNRAFNYCYSLPSITIPNEATISDRAFSDCNTLASISIPSSTTSINLRIVYSCFSLTGITIPSGVTSIGDYVFGYCYSLANLTIPSGVTSIGQNAFSGCSGMTEYHIKPTTPPTLGTNAFQSIASDCKIYVPSASLTDYQGTANWSTYASYMVGE